MADHAPAVQQSAPAPRSKRGHRGGHRKAGTSTSQQDDVASADPAPKTSRRAEAATAQASAKLPVPETSSRADSTAQGRALPLSPPTDGPPAQAAPLELKTTKPAAGPKKNSSRTLETPSSSSANKVRAIYIYFKLFSELPYLLQQPTLSQSVNAAAQSEPVPSASKVSAQLEKVSAAAGGASVVVSSLLSVCACPSY